MEVPARRACLPRTCPTASRGSATYRRMIRLAKFFVRSAKSFSAFLLHSAFFILHSEVLRLIARFPFDIAADAGLLIERNGLAGEHGIQRRPKVFAGHGDSVARAAVIELAPINQI